MSDTRPAPSATIKAWTQERQWDAVIWTALTPNFEEQAGQPFTFEAAGAYLQGLPEPAKAKALEYIRKAPEEAVTPVRRAATQTRLIPPLDPDQP